MTEAQRKDPQKPEQGPERETISGDLTPEKPLDPAGGSNELIKQTENDGNSLPETVPPPTVEPLGSEQVGASATGSTGSGARAIGAVTAGVDFKNPQGIKEALKDTSSESKRKSDETGLLLFTSLEAEYILKVENVFVDPDGFQDTFETVSNDPEERIFFVQGPENSGKGIAAAKIGLEICRQQNFAHKKIISHIGKDISIRSLIAFLEAPETEEESIYVIRDVFDHGLSMTDFSDSVRSALHKLLKSDRSFLILTTTRSREQLQSLKSYVFSSALSESQVPECFIKHLDLYETSLVVRPIPAEITGLIRANLADINRGFRIPNQIDYFFEQISKDALKMMMGKAPESKTQELSEPDEKVRTARLIAALLKLAQQARRYGLLDQESTQLWFERLHENIQLFALLSVILQGFRFDLIEEIYEKAVEMLINNKVGKIEHASIFGRNKILTFIHARLDDESFIVFENQAYLAEIVRQIDYRHLLLWPLVKLFVGYIQQYKDREYWVLRRELGAAIGRIGIFGYGKLDGILNDLALHENGGVVASAGSALAEICSLDVKHYSYVIAVIRRWVDSGDPDLMWAAGASIWRIYETLIRALKDEPADSRLSIKTREAIQSILASLTDLAGSVGIFNEDVRWAVARKSSQIASRPVERNPNLLLSFEEAQAMARQLLFFTMNNIDSVLHAIRQMLWIQPEEIVALVETWINTDGAEEGKASTIRGLGLLAAHELFGKAYTVQKQGLYELNLPLMKLIQPLLAKGHRETIQLMMETLNNWMSEQDLAEQVESLLLPIVNRLDETELRIFRSGVVKYWLSNTVKPAHRLGKALIGRSYMIQGSPLGLPDRETACLLWDTSAASRAAQVEDIARKIYIRVNARQSAGLFALGQAKSLRFSDVYPSIEELQRAPHRPPLIYPVVNPERSEKIDFVIAVLHDRILDLEDIETDFIKEKCLFVRLRGIPAEPLDDIPADCWIEPKDYFRLEQFLDRTIASRLARMDPALEDRIRSFLNNDTSTGNAANLLNSWVDLMDTPTSLRFKDTEADLAHILSYALVWLAHRDLPACLQLLENWIQAQPAASGGEPPLQRHMGFSGGRLVINVLGQVNALDSDSFSQLLGFATRLVRQGTWDDQRIVLPALRNWVKDEKSYQAVLQLKGGKAGTVVLEERPPTLLDSLAESVPQSHYADLLKTIESWLEEKDANHYLKRVASQLKTKALLRQSLDFGSRSDLDKQVIHAILHGTELPALPENRRYGLMIFNASASSEELAGVAVETFQALSTGKDFYPVMLRVGQRIPVGIGDQAVSPESLFHAQIYALPRLVAPLLDNLHAAQFTFGIFFGSEASYDWEEWREPWKDIVWLTYPIDKATTIGWPPTLDVEEPISEPKRQALQIVKYISDRVKG